MENVCSFAANLRSHSRSHSLRPASTENETINIQVTLSPEELTDTELQQSHIYKEFCTIFRPGVLNSAQRQAFYKTFRDHIKNNPKGKPHLTITAAILLLMKKTHYGKPLQGQFHTIRKTVFTSLGEPDTTAKNYKETSLSKTTSPTLYKYTELPYISIQSQRPNFFPQLLGRQDNQTLGQIRIVPHDTLSYNHLQSRK